MNDLNLLAKDSEVFQLLKIGHPETLRDVRTPQVGPGLLEVSRQFEANVQSVMSIAPDPYKALSQIDVAEVLTYYGVDPETAHNMATKEFLEGVSGVDLDDKNFVQALKTKAQHSWWGDMAGLNTSLYAMTGSKSFLDNSAEYRRKMFANPVLQSYGELGDLALDSVQPTLSALKFMAVNAVLSWIPGGAANAIWGPTVGKLVASSGLQLANATNFFLTGYSQAGQILDEVMSLTDAEGNTLPWDSAGSMILFHGLAGLMGIVELGSMEMMPWYAQMKRQFSQREIGEFVKIGFREGAKQFAFNAAKGTFSEASEEFTQTGLGIGFTEILKSMANKGGAQFEHISIGEAVRQGTQAFWEAGKSMALTSILFEGFGLGVGAGTRSYQAGKYFNKTKGSKSVDLGFIGAKTNGAQASETAREGKMDPVKVISLGSHLSPIDDVEMRKVLDAGKAGAKVVEVEVQGMGTMEAGDRESLLHRAAIASGGKISGGSIVFEDEQALNRGAYVLQHSIESVEQGESGTNIVLRDENGDLVWLNLRVAEEADEIVEPDVSFYDDPEAPHSLARMSQDKALEWEERKRIREALGDIVGHTGGNISQADLEANIDAIKLVGDTLGLTTDEMLRDNLTFRLIDEAPTGARGYIDNVSTEDGPRYTIHLTRNADATTIIHEVGHFLRGMATKEQLQSFTEHYGRGGSVVWLEDVVQNEDGTYSVGEQTYETFEEVRKLVERNEEAFANDFVTYLRTGEAPIEELGNIFRRMKAVLRKFISEFGYRLDPKVKASFDELLSKPGSGAGGGAAGAAGSALWQRSNEFANMMHRLITDDFRDHRERTKFLSSLHRVVPYQDWNFSLDIPHAMKVRSTGIEIYGSLRKHIQQGDREMKRGNHPEITDDILMGMQDALENPVAVIGLPNKETGEFDGNMLYLTDMHAKVWRAPVSMSDVGRYVDRPVVFALKTMKTEDWGQRTVVLTGYGLGHNSNLTDLNYLARNGMLLALDEERGSHVFTGTKPDASTLQEASPRRIVKLPVNVNKQRQFQSAPAEGSAMYNSLVEQAHELLKADGKLIPFYHGSAVVIDDYDTSKRGAMTGAGSAELAFFFTNSEEVAQEYADLAVEAEPMRQRETELEKEIDALLDAMTELAVDDFDSEEEYEEASDELDERRNDLMEELEQLQEYITSGDQFYFRDEWEADGEPVVNRVVLAARNLLVVEGDDINIYSVVRQAKDEGYDGVYFKDIQDSPSESVVADNVAIFDPGLIYSDGVADDDERLYQQAPSQGFYDYQDANMERTHKQLFYIDGMNNLFAERIENAGDIGRELSKLGTYGWMSHGYVSEKLDKLSTILEGGHIGREFLQRPATAELRAQEQEIIDRYKEQYDAYPGDLGILGEVSKRLSFAILDRDLYSALDAWAEFINLWNPLRVADGQKAFPIGEYSAYLQWAVKDKAAEMVVGDQTSALSDELADNTLYQFAPKEGWGRGYDSSRNMSVNAIDAYDRGVMPKHKWTKTAFSAIWSDLTGLPLPNLSADELKSSLLKSDEWHHTGKNYKATNFYHFSLDAARALVAGERGHVYELEYAASNAYNKLTNWVAEAMHDKGVTRQEAIDLLEAEERRPAEEKPAYIYRGIKRPVDEAYINSIKSITDEDVNYYNFGRGNDTSWMDSAAMRNNESLMEQAGYYPTTLFQEAAPVDSQEFKEWFGDSKVVDEDGEPLVVYHATDAIFESFDFERLGEFTDYNTSEQSARNMARLGVWSSVDPVNKFTSQDISMPLYYKIENPLSTDFDALWAQASEYESPEAFKELFTQDGYDGLIVQDTEFDTTSFVAFSPEQIKSINNHGTWNATNPNILFQDAPPDYQPKSTGIGYKVFVQKDGKLYPPMVANPNGEETPVGKWLLADEAPIAAYSKTGRPQVKSGGKGTQGRSGLLAYRPGWHLGEIPYAKQFNRLNPATGIKELFPKDFVWAEVEYSKDNDYNDEARQNGVSKNGGFNHALASLQRMPTDGFYNYRTNPDPTTDAWIITGAMKVNKLLSREEVEDLVRKAGREPQKVVGDTLFQEAPPVESEAFKAWFGDSKVVDENKQPLVLYHGTDAEFDSFVPKDGKKRVSNKQLDFGSHFTVSREYAQTYSRKGNVIPVYLSMNNPLDLVDAYFAYKGDPLFDALFGLYNDLGQKPLPDMYRDRDGNKHDDVQAVFMNAHILNALPPARALAAIKDAGFDGVKYQPYQRQGLDRYTKDPVSYIAISPTQVKSATDNVGTYDPYNPSILYQVEAYHGSPHQFDRFSLDYVGTGEGAQVYGWGLYFTDNKSIAEYYARELTTPDMLLTYTHDEVTLTDRDGFPSDDGEWESPESQAMYYLRIGIDADTKDILHTRKGKEMVREEAIRLTTISNSKSALAARRFLEEMDLDKLEFGQNKRKLYKATLLKGRDQDSHAWLEWNKLLIDQSEKTRKAIEDVIKKWFGAPDDIYTKDLWDQSLRFVFSKAEWDGMLDIEKEAAYKLFEGDLLTYKEALMNSLTGEVFYHDLVEKIRSFYTQHPGARQLTRSGYDSITKAASLNLLSEGIDGVMYPAASMGRGDGSKGHNYVVFDENSITMESITLFQEAPPIESKAFKDWFKESKVVDENGYPLAVYHYGSFNENIDTPDTPMHFGTREAAMDRSLGKYYEDNLRDLEVYEDDDGSWNWSFWDEDGPGGYISEEIAKTFGTDYALEIIRDGDIDFGENDYTSVYLSIQNPKRVSDVIGVNGEWQDEIEKAKSEGYDGIVYSNKFEDIGRDSYIAFTPTQIKSIHNQGTWDATNPNILFQEAPPTDSEAFKDWFGDWENDPANSSKALDGNAKPLVLYRGSTQKGVNVLPRSFEAGVGIFLTDSPSVAEIFRYEREYGDVITERYDESADEYVDVEGGDLYQLYANIRSPKVFEGEEAQRLTDDTRLQAEAIRVAKEEGHDGIILRNVQEGVASWTETGTTYVVLDPSQVKSINNQGTWDANNPNILFQAAQPAWDGTVLSIADLRRMGVERIFPLLADRTMAGIEFTGYRSIMIDPTLMLGGPGFPTMEQHRGLGWAVQGTKQRNMIRDRIAETGGYAVVVMMQDNTHQSNNMVAGNYIKLVEQAIHEGGRISEGAIAKINEEIQGIAALEGIPGIGTVEFDQWLETASFEKRKALMTLLSAVRIQGLGLPPVDGYLQSTMERRFNVPSLDPGDGLMIIKLDADNIQEGVHPSYRYAIGGEVIGFMRKPLGRNLLFEQIMANYKGQQNVDYNDIRRSVELTMPSIEITGKMVELDMSGGYEHISGPRHARMVLDGMLDEWSTTDTLVKDGGVKIADYRKALLANDGWVSYPHRDFSTLEKDVKAGRAKVYKLGESDVYFALIRETPWHSKITGAGEEVVLTGVINNELYGGALPLIMAKAIEEGATMLDAFDVQTQKYGRGTASVVYSRYGFEQVGEPIQVSAEEFLQGRDKSVLADAQVYWDSLGWTRQSDVPPVVVMRLNEERIGGRAGYLQRLGAQDVQDILPGTTGEGLTGAEHDLQHGRGHSGLSRRSESGDGLGAGGSEGRDGRAHGRAHVSAAAQEILDLSDIDILNLNLDAEKVRRARDIYASQQTFFQSAPPTNSAEFRQMFEHSKAVDKEGNPLELYHGSPVVGLAALDNTGHHRPNWGEEGYTYATDSAEAAERFAYEQLPGSSSLTYKEGERGQVYKVFMDLRSPLDFRSLSATDIANIKDAAKRFGAFQDQVAEVFNKHTRGEGKYSLQFLKRQAEDLVKRLSEYGYDGLITELDNDGHLEYAVVSPNQVYLATDVVEIDGVQYTIHDTEHVYSEEEIRDITTGVDRDLAEISQRSDLRSILYQPSSEGSSAPLRLGAEQIHPDFGTVRWNPHRGYSRLRGWDGTEADPRIDEDWRRFRKIDFAGYKIKSATELAQLFSIYRNPMVEYFHIIYTKQAPGGYHTIVGHRAMTSGSPNSAVAFPRDFPITHIRDHYALDADGYFLMHNHPSGEVNPSNADRGVTHQYIMAPHKTGANPNDLGKFRGHLILNHNKYSLLTSYGTEVVGIEVEGFHDVPIRPFINDSLTSIHEVAAYAMKTMSNREALVVYVDIQNRVVNVEPASLGGVDYASVAKVIDENLYHKAFYVTTNDTDWQRIVDEHKKNAINGGVFIDVISLNRDGSLGISAVDMQENSFGSLNRHDIRVRNNATYRNYVFEPERLYQLSDEAKQEVLDRRKEDVKQAVDRFFWVPDEILSEYAGEDWADEEILFRSRMREFPELERQALEYASVDEYLEAMETEDAGEQQWYRRVFEYARIMDPKDKDAQFVRIFSTDRGLIRLASLLRAYTDYRDGREVQRWGSFRGVSTLVKSLNSESSSEDLQRARELVQKDPRPYRRALQTVEQAQDRVQEARGQSPTSQANRDAYYDALGETMQDELKPSLGDMTNREAAEFLRTSPDRRDRYDARDRLATHAGVWAVEQQANAELKNLGVQKDADINKLQRQLAKTRKEATKIGSELKEQKRALKSAQSALDKETARRKDYADQAREHKSTAGKLARDLKDRRERVATLKSQLSEKREEVRNLKTRAEKLQQRITAERRRKALERVHDNILAAARFNPDSVDASFEQAMNAIVELFAQDGRPGPYKMLPEQMRQYLGDEALHWVQQGRRITDWTLGELEALEEAVRLMRMDGRLMLERKKMHRSAALQDYALRYYAQLHGTAPDVDFALGGVMGQIMDDLNETHPKYKETPFNAFFNTIVGSIIHSQRLARLIDGNREGVMYDLLVRQPYEHASSELANTFRRMEAAEAMMKELGITDSYLDKELYTYTTTAGQEIDLNRGEVIGLYVYSQNEESMQKLIMSWGNAIPVDQLSEAVSKLSDKDKAWGDYMIDALGGDDAWERMRDVYYNVYNRNLGRRQRYFTFVAEGKVDEGNTDLLVGPRGDTVRYVDKGMTKPIVPNARYALKLDVTSTFKSQVKRQEHFISWAAWVRDTNYLLSRLGSVGQMIEMNHGPKILKQVQEFTNAVGSPQTILQDIERLGNKLVSSAAVANLSFNMVTVLKQFASISAAVRGDIEVGMLFNAARRLANPAEAKKIVSFIHEKSPLVKNRTFDVEIAKYKATDFDSKIAKGVKKLNTAGMKLAELTDAATANVLWLAAYDTAIKRGLGEEEAVFRATQLIAETQSSSNTADLSLVQRMKNPWVRAVMQYTNDAFQHINQVWFDLPFYVKNKNYKQAIGTVVSLSIAWAITLLVGGHFFKDDKDDDEKRRRLQGELLQLFIEDTIPIIGRPISMGASGWRGSNDLVSLPSELGQLLGALSRSDGKGLTKEFWDLVESASKASGLPMTQVRRTIKAVEESNPLHLMNNNWSYLWEDR